MSRKYLIAGSVAFILLMILSFVAHGLLLEAERAQVATLFRPGPEVLNYFPYMLASHLIKGFALAWIYQQGLSPQVPWLAQGIRFGILMALVIAVPYYLVYYAAMPLPGGMVVKQIAFDSIIIIVIAIAIAFVYRNSPSKVG